MCSHSASVKTGMIYRSHIQIDILAQSQNNTQETCVYKLNKTKNTVILLQCILSFSVTSTDKIISLSMEQSLLEAVGVSTLELTQ